MPEDSGTDLGMQVDMDFESGLREMLQKSSLPLVPLIRGLSNQQVQKQQTLMS